MRKLSLESFISRIRLSTSILVTIVLACTTDEPKKKDALYLSVNVVTTKVLIGDTIFTSPNGDRTSILQDHLNHMKVYPLAGKSQYLHFSVVLRP